jgi:DNA-binding MarR family transcriptional regulator
MAWQVSKRVWDHTRIKTKEDKDKFKPAHRLVLLALAEIADENGICWPKFDTSYQTLADMAGIERRSAIRVIDDLIRDGYLFKGDTKGRGNSNVYIVTIGLSELEKEEILLLNGDLGVTNYKEESKKMVTWESPIKTEKVTRESLASDLGVTFSTLNGDLGVTHPIIKSPSISSLAKETKPKQSTVKGEAQEMFKTLAEVCQYDLGLISNKERGQLNQAEKKMRDKGYTPNDLKAFEKWWYAEDWRGKQQQPPTLNQIRETWGRFLNRNGTNGRDSPPKPKYITIPVTNQESSEND